MQAAIWISTSAPLESQVWDWHRLGTDQAERDLTYPVKIVLDSVGTITPS